MTDDVSILDNSKMHSLINLLRTANHITADNLDLTTMDVFEILEQLRHKTFASYMLAYEFSTFIEDYHGPLKELRGGEQLMGKQLQAFNELLAVVIAFGGLLIPFAEMLTDKAIEEYAEKAVKQEKEQ